MTPFEQQLQMLRARFLDHVSADAAEIERGVAAQAWRSVRDLSHSINGRAGMFGFPALSDSARALEQAIDGNESSGYLEQLARALVADLRGLAERR